MKVKELIEQSTNFLKQSRIEDANMKAMSLIAHVLNVRKSALIMYQDEEVSPEDDEKYIGALSELINGSPLQYITKNQEFMGINFYVDENVLIPQPDTEILVEEVLEYIGNLSRMKRIGNDEIDTTIDILDLCTGSGAIAVSIAKHTKEDVVVYASDVSEEAINVAKENAKINNVNVEYIVSDLFKKIPDKKFDIIVSNPPYIQTDLIRKLSRDVQKEPRIALDGGKDGLDFYRMIAKQANQYLKEDGILFLEIGYDQKEDVVALFQQIPEYRNIETKKDLARNDRVIIVKK